MMLALRRRYRAFLVVAVLFTLSLYRLRQVREWDAPPFGGGLSQDQGQHVEPTSPVILLATASLPLETPLVPPASLDADPSRLSSKSPTSSRNDATLLDDPGVLATSKPAASNTQHTSEEPSETTPPVISESDRLLIDDILSNKFEYHGQGRLEIDKQSSSLERPHWQPQKEHFPVPSSEIIPLPTDRPKQIPAIQHKFGRDTKDEKEVNKRRLGDVKKAFQHAWSGYKEFAMPHDELSPISKDFKDPFNGWGATLVDSLDTLWIMDLKDEFDEAVKVVAKIDFKTSIRKDIPLFETVIRYLGGLVAAHDVSSGNYPVLLEKALELAEILMGVFDTPNRMPITYYNWAPSYASQPHRASTKAVLAELGSLSLEFTRLAQITKQDKYYDAVARITNELEAWQNNTRLPGLWPALVDASGCKKPEQTSWEDTDFTVPEPGNVPPSIPKSDTILTDEHKDYAKGPEIVSPDEHKIGAVERRQVHGPEALLGRNSGVGDIDCQSQGLASPPQEIQERFTLGAMSDSTYEYLPKEWLLLGGLNHQYQSMYQEAVTAIRKNLIYRPMTKTERNIRFAGTVRNRRLSKGQSESESSEGNLDFEGQHLTCFAGGMFALGARIFGIDADLEIAQKLTDGCVWAYESTATGIMPESFRLVPCEDDQQCLWNETRWGESLDPDRRTREAKAKTWLEQHQYPGQVDSTIKTEEPFDTNLPRLPADAKNEDKLQPPLGRGGGAGELPSVEKLGRREALEAAEGPALESDALTEPTQVHPESAEGESGKEAAEASHAPAPAFTPKYIAPHQEFVQTRIKEERLPEGFSQIDSKKYILRPEAIESVFVMYRVTGDKYWQEQGWKMFTAIQASTETAHGNSAITDVTSDIPPMSDSMESFWLAETLKYFFLLYSDPSLISLDEFVLNTEAHPFRRPT